MTYCRKLFKKEHREHIIDYSPGKMKIPNAEMVLMGNMFHYRSVKEKVEQEYLFILTRNYLYYVEGKACMGNGKMSFSYKARIHLGWLEMSLIQLNKNKEKQFYLALSNSMKKVIFRLASEKDSERWTKHLSPFLLQDNFLKKFDILKQLGSGSSCSSYKVREKKTQKIYACKRFKKEGFSDDAYTKLVREITMLRYLKGHPNVTQLHSVFESENSVYIVLEYCQGGQLFDIEKGCSMEEIHFLLNFFLELLKSFKKKKVVHGSLFLNKIFLKYKNKPLKYNAIKVVSFNRTRMEKDADDVAFNYQRDIQKVGEIMFMALTGKTHLYIDTAILDDDKVNKSRKLMFLKTFKNMPHQRKLNSSRYYIKYAYCQRTR